MLNNFSVKGKLSIALGLVITGLVILAVVSYIRLSNLKSGYEATNTVTEIRLLVIGSLADGLQCGQALRNVYINPNDETGMKNLEVALEDLSKGIEALKQPKYTVLSQGLTKFNIVPLYEDFSRDMKRLLAKAKAKETITESEIKDNTSKFWRPFRTALRDWSKANEEKSTSMISEYNSDITATTTANIVLSIIIIIALIIVILFISQAIVNSLNSFKDGLMSFFAFLNKETNKADLIHLDSKDEFGQMADITNQNIKKIESNIK